MTTRIANLEVLVVLLEERATRDRGEFDADHALPMVSQPDQILGLAAERHENAPAIGPGHLPRMGHQARIDVFLMKADPIVLPAIEPECLVHDSPPQPLP